MIANDVLRAIAVATILLADRPDRLVWLYIALITENLGGVFFRPAARALLPAIVGTGPKLVNANALMAVNNGIVRLLGPPLGAGLLAWLGIGPVVLLDLASYLVSALMITMTARRPSPNIGTRVELREGLRFTWHHPTLRRLLVASSAFFTVNAVMTTLLIPLMTTRFGHHPTPIGYLFTALGIGYLIGAPLSARLVRRYRAGPLFAFASTGICLSFVLLVTAPTVEVAITSGGLIGLLGSLLLVTLETTIQRETPDALRGRVGAAFFASDALAALVGALIAVTCGTHLLSIS